MAPSRGALPAPTPKPADDDDTAVDQQSTSALKSAKRNFNYLLYPASTAATDRPARFRTRALLRTLRYLGQFLIWRLVRWAKYIAVGSLVAAVGATAIGSAASGVAWIVAPTSIGAGAAAWGVWGVGRFMAKRLHARWKHSGGDLGVEVRETGEGRLAGDVRREGSYGVDVGPRAVPW